METYTYNPADKKSLNTFIGRIYGYMFFGLLLTAIIAIGVGLLFNLWIFGTLNISSDLGNVTSIDGSGVIALFITMIVSGIALFIFSFVVHRRAFREKSVAIPAFIYCVLMGTMLSSLVIFVPWPVLGITFGITSSIFGIMFLISYFGKGSLNSLSVIGIGLFLGAAFLSLIGWIFMLTGFLGNKRQPP